MGPDPDPPPQDASLGDDQEISSVVRGEVFGDRAHVFQAPAWVVFDALSLNDEKQRDHGTWLHLELGEVEPRILEAIPYARVVWSSLWPVSPNDTIQFDLAHDDRHWRNTSVRFRWFSETPPDARGIGITRQRLNRKLGSDLRAWVDSAYSTVLWDRPDEP